MKKINKQIDELNRMIAYAEDGQEKTQMEIKRNNLVRELSK